MNTRTNRDGTAADARARAREKRDLAREILEEFLALDIEWHREKRMVIETLNMPPSIAWRHIQYHYAAPWQPLWQYRRMIRLALKHHPGALEKVLREQEAWKRRRRPYRYSDATLAAIARELRRR